MEMCVPRKLEETKWGMASKSSAEMLFADVLLEVEQAACTKEMMTMELE